MSLRLVQLRSEHGERQVAALRPDGRANLLEGFSSTYSIAKQAIRDRKSLSDLASGALSLEVDLASAESDGRLLPPIDHEDPAHLQMTGTGLTHLGSAEGRNKMHQAAAAG
ncbi:MAG: FAH family protein, partial [Sphingomicrobium sp.]